MIQSPDGGFRWFTNPKSTQIKRDSGCNNVNYFENNKFVQLQHDEDRTTIRIRTNQSKFWSLDGARESRYGRQRAPSIMRQFENPPQIGSITFFLSLPK